MQTIAAQLPAVAPEPPQSAFASVIRTYECDPTNGGPTMELCGNNNRKCHIPAGGFTHPEEVT
jgi:hypothetical protein